MADLQQQSSPVLRSLLFVPADDERKLTRGLESLADALILDLEDSVAPARKSIARDLCARTLKSAQTPKKLFVRINALDTEDALLDLVAIAAGCPFGIVLPKCRGSADVQLLAHYLSALEAREQVAQGSVRILAIATESAAAMFGLSSYKNASPRLWGLLWGGEDLAADLGAIANREADGRYAPPYQLASALCLYAAADASVMAIDAVYTDFRDISGLREEAVRALRNGFAAKAAIHPDQVAPINEVFTPSQDDVEKAQRIVAAFQKNADVGVVSLDGRMIDRPHYRNALQVLARAGITVGQVGTISDQKET